MTLTRKQGIGVVKLILIGFAVNFCVIGYVFAQSYIGRQNLAKTGAKARHELVLSQRGGCERAKKDRASAIQVYSSIVAAFNETDKQIPGAITSLRNDAETKIRASITDIQARVRIDCKEKFPDGG